MVPAASEYERRLQEYEREVADLQGQLKALEEEVVVLRRRLQDAPKRVRTLEERLLETKGQLAQAVSQNERLSATLREAREHIAALREEVEKLTMPPSGYGTFLETNDDGTVDVFTRRPEDAGLRCTPRSTPPSSRRARRSCSTSRFNVVLARGLEVHGRGRHPQGAARGREAGAHRRPGRRGAGRASWPTRCIGEKLRAGDTLLMEGRSGLLVEKLPRPEVEELVLEEVPDITYDDVGGLDDQIEMIKDAVELPYLYADLFNEHELPAAQGHPALRPAGLRQDAHRQGGGQLAGQAGGGEDRATSNVRSYFLNIKGPELLNKYVGETERQIRLIFQRAREKSDEGVPVIVFFDEMDSLFRTRGTGISSDIEIDDRAAAARPRSTASRA